MAAICRVTLNRFIAAGGDNFTVFKQSKAAQTGVVAIDARVAFAHVRSPLSLAVLDRIRTKLLG